LEENPQDGDEEPLRLIKTILAARRQFGAINGVTKYSVLGRIPSPPLDDLTIFTCEKR
jgi:hypothetical protein